jgi:IPT/TIG domain
MRSRSSIVVSFSPRALALTLAVLGASLGGVACESGGEMAITGINPRAGHIAGDQTVEIQGKNFRMDIGYAVYFGKAKAGNVTIRSSEAIMVTSPSGSPGAVDVTVRPDNGAAFVLKQAFTYEDMGGSVVEGIGKPGTTKNKGNLAY